MNDEQKEQEIKDREQRFKDEVIAALFSGAIVDAFPGMHFVRSREGDKWVSKHHLNGDKDKKGKNITFVYESRPYRVYDANREEGRGIIDLYMDQNNLDYISARKELSQITKVALPDNRDITGTAFDPNSGLPQQSARIKSAEIFKTALWSGTVEADKALYYLRNGRGLTDEKIEKMGIGFITREIQKGLPDNVKNECYYFGVEDSAIVIPYTSGERILGFKFRGIKNKGFINSKGLPKSAALFNIKKRQDEAIVVESELDAALADASGIYNVVATGGGPLSDAQIDDARNKGVRKFILLLDNDENGIEFTKKSIKHINDDENVTVVTGLPEGIKDPGEYMQRYDVESLKQIISKAKPAIIYKYEEFINPGNDKDFEQFVRNEQSLRRVEDQTTAALEKAKQLIEGGRLDEAFTLIGETARLKISTREKEFSRIFAEPSAEEYHQTVSRLNEGLPTGIRFGERPFQEVLTLNPGLTFFAGNSGHGKTSVLNCIALNEARRNLEMGNGKRVLYFSYEIDKGSVFVNLVNTFVDNPEISINPFNSIKGYYNTKPGEEKDRFFYDYSHEPGPERDPNKKRKNYEDFITKEKIFQSGYILSGAIVVIEKSYTVESLLDALTYAIDRNDVSLVCIDYAQLIYSEQYSRQRTEEIKRIVQQIKDFANEKQLPIVMAAQFNQKVPTPANVKLTNIGEGGDFARIADTVVGIFNLEAFDLDVMESDEALKPLRKFGIQTYNDCRGKMYLRLLKRRNSLSYVDTIVEWRGPSKKFVPNYPGDLNVDAIQASLQLTENDEAKRKADEEERERNRSKF